MSDEIAERRTLEIEYLDLLVKRVEKLRRNSIATLKDDPTPNFVVVEPEPILPTPCLIPFELTQRPPMSWRRMVAGSAGAAVTVVCLCTAVALYLVQTP